MVTYTAKQYLVFRTIFGLYLFYHFYGLIDYECKIFGPGGLLPDPEINPTWEIFGKIPGLHFLNDCAMMQFMIHLLCVMTILIIVGIRLAALVTWLGWIYLFNRNNLIINPGMPYVGWLLLVVSVMNFNSGHNRVTWYMPTVIYWSAWILMAGGYTISGLHKLQCQSWIDGTALKYVLVGFLSRNFTLMDLLINQFEYLLVLMTWISLAMEITFLPLGSFYHTRKWYWFGFFLMQLGIMALVNFTDLTLGVLMIHLFTFDSEWLEEFPLNRLRFALNRLGFALNRLEFAAEHED